MTESRRARHLRTSWIVLGGLTLLAAGMTWPLIAKLSSRFPGTDTWAFDESTFAWNLWYFKHALLDLHVSPLHTDLIWYPLGIDLILYTYNFFNALIALPLQLALSLPVASNLTLLVATVLSGFGAYLLALSVLGGKWANARVLTGELADAQAGSRRDLSLHLAALLAGIIYAFASNRAVYAALGHYNFYTTQWLPFFALYLLKTLRQPGIRNAIMAGLFFALAALAEITYASFLVLFALVALVALWKALPRRRDALGRICVAGAVACLLWSPILLPVAREFLSGDYALSGWGESVKLSADLIGLETPTDLNPALRPLSASAALGATAGQSQIERWKAELRAVEEGKGRFSDINTVFLGYLTLALAAVGGITGGRRAAVWRWVALVFGILALGPLLQINGRFRFSLDNLLPEGITFPLPSALLHYVPLLNANRASNRNSLILMPALAILAALGAQWLLEKIEVRKTASENRLARPLLIGGAAAVLALGILAEHLAVPLPTTDAGIPGIYRQIAAEPGNFAVMQLPLGWRNSFGVLGSEQTQLQYFQTALGKPIIGGNISRAPAFKMEYFGRIPLFKALTDLEMYKPVAPATDSAARDQAAALMALFDVRYIVTTPPIPGRYPYQDTWRETEAYALDVLPLEKPAFWEQDGYSAYRVNQPAIPNPFRLDLGTPGAEPYLGEGWSSTLEEQPYGDTGTWATGPSAELFLPMAGPVTSTLRLALAPLSYDGAPPQKVSISVNGVPVLRDRLLAPGWQPVEAVVPAGATRRGPNRVRLDFAWTASPRKVLPDAASRAVIGSTGITSPANLDVHGFDEAFISATAADGKVTNSSTGRRGYNVAVFDPRDGRLLDARGFDTAANSFEAEALATFLASLRPGLIVALATKGDAAANLTPAAIAALRGLGSRVGSAAELSGQSHAMVGVQGARAGSAAEQIAPRDAFVRVAGDFRTLAAALDWVELGQ